MSLNNNWHMIHDSELNFPYFFWNFMSLEPGSQALAKFWWEFWGEWDPKKDIWLGGGNSNIFLGIFTPTWGNHDPIWRVSFSGGKKTPTSYLVMRSYNRFFWEGIDPHIYSNWAMRSTNFFTKIWMGDVWSILLGKPWHIHLKCSEGCPGWVINLALDTHVWVRS